MVGSINTISQSASHFHTKAVRGEALLIWFSGNSTQTFEAAFAVTPDPDDSDLLRVARSLLGNFPTDGISLGDFIGMGIAAVGDAPNPVEAWILVAKTIVSETARRAVAWYSQDTGAVNYSTVSGDQYDAVWVWIKARLDRGQVTTIKQLQRRLQRACVPAARQYISRQGRKGRRESDS